MTVVEVIGSVVGKVRQGTTANVNEIGSGTLSLSSLYPIPNLSRSSLKCLEFTIPSEHLVWFVRMFSNEISGLCLRH